MEIKRKLTENLICQALVKDMIRTHICVPNVSWGFFHDHEADLVSVNNVSGYLTEYEIKVSWADWKKDVEKDRWRDRLGNLKPWNNKIKVFNYVIPHHVWIRYGQGFEFVHQNMGVITFTLNSHGAIVFRHVRPAKAFKDARPITDKGIAKLSRLGVMRYWSRLSEFHTLSRYFEATKPLADLTVGTGEACRFRTADIKCTLDPMMNKCLWPRHCIAELGIVRVGTQAVFEKEICGEVN